MSNVRTKLLIPLAFFLFFIPGSALLAFDGGDGFSAAEESDGTYFTIYFASGQNMADLSRQLDVRSSDMLLAGENPDRGYAGQTAVARMVDALFLRVCGIMDMNLYSFHGSIKVCRDMAQTREIYDNLFNKDLGNRVSFYVYDLNTIYIAAPNFKKEILGHEIAHALICHYFAVSPSIKIQEVLAAYVEYQLRG